MLRLVQQVGQARVLTHTLHSVWVINCDRTILASVPERPVSAHNLDNHSHRLLHLPAHAQVLMAFGWYYPERLAQVRGHGTDAVQSGMLVSHNHDQE